MEKLIKKLRKILEMRFRDAVIELEPLSSGTKVTGTIVWKGFGRYDNLKRHELLQRSLEKALTLDERRNLSLISCFTPREAEFVNAQDPD
jgi:hypothetical protein